MIDQERVREMTKLAAMEKNEGRKYQNMVRYYRSDYLIRQLLKSFVAGTLAFALIVGLWIACNLDAVMSDLNNLDFDKMLSPLLSRYFVFIIIYLVLVDIYASVRYAAGQDSLRRYERHLKRLCRMYEQQESRMAPNGLGETDDGVHGI